MKIESITIKGFRCFDDVGETIKLDNFSCFIGPNASGKTAAMMALVRVFGESNALRQIVPSDFHLKNGEELKAESQRKLLIECKLSFPELENTEGALAAITESFNQMVVDEPGGTPFCRIRLDATWMDDGTPLGDVEQSISWILTESNDPKEIEDGNRRRVQPGDRAKIRVIYIPAARDPNKQIKVTTNTNLGRLLQTIEWGGVDESISEKLSALQQQITSLSGIQTINNEIKDIWNKLYDGKIAHEVSFRALEEDPAALIKLLTPVFSPGEDGCRMCIDDLSDGMKSLFSLSLSLGLYQVEEKVRLSTSKAGFKNDICNKFPSLSIFVIEEPENHLSPHYLGSIINELVNIADNQNVQVLVSSHSPCILKRIQPDCVRYFLGHEHTRSTNVKEIPLPEDENDEAFKYVREAVRGYPELYFSRLVILGEGASEEIVLRRLFEAHGEPLDTNFISVVPLGGRHVNHFWRLLHGLEIPFITLLDLDREKKGAGWGRIQYVRNQLVERFGDDEALCFKALGRWNNLGCIKYENLKKRSGKKVIAMNTWLNMMANKYDVYFSSPLDLDFSMLEAFTEIYKGLALKGPSLPKPDDSTYWETIKKRMRSVLWTSETTISEDLGDTYDLKQQQLFAWYKYLFIDGSKPVNHMRAVLKIEDSLLKSNAPPVLKQIIKRAQKILSHSEGDV